MPFKDRDKAKANGKKNYQANREKRIRQAAEYKKAFPESRDVILARSRKWREKNREKLNAMARVRSAGYRRADPERFAKEVRAYTLRTKFGLSLENFDALLVEQGGLCAICRRPETHARGGRAWPLSVDHDHVTGKVRGLLCNNCNRGLGLLSDDPLLTRAATAYLERGR